MISDGFQIEIHPFEPYIPQNAKVLIMGTFPPQPKRWRMDFYYPNPTNDFWRIMGILFENDRYAFFSENQKDFDLEKIKSMLNSKGIALNDTGHAVQRLQDNASDKYLNIVEQVDLQSLLNQMPECRNIATTGEKAAQVISEQTHTVVPKMGMYIESENGLIIWRMPSTSRAYPLNVEKKAQYYARLFEMAGIPLNKNYHA